MKSFPLPPRAREAGAQGTAGVVVDVLTAASFGRAAIIVEAVETFTGVAWRIPAQSTG